MLKSSMKLEISIKTNRNHLVAEGKGARFHLTNKNQFNTDEMLFLKKIVRQFCRFSLNEQEISRFSDCNVCFRQIHFCPKKRV